MSYTRIDDEDDDSASPVLWDNNFWIRPDNPRLYPTVNIPPAVRHERKRLLQLPPATDTLLPHDFLPVLDLLQTTSYPRPRQDLVRHPIKYTNKIPDSNAHAIVKVIQTRTVPPILAIEKLEAQFGQAWFDGSTALIDTQYADYALPFWTLTVWRELHFLHNLRLRWTSVEQRIQRAAVSVFTYIQPCQYIHNKACHIQQRAKANSVKLRIITDSLMDLLREVAWHAPLSGFPSGGWRGGFELTAPSSPRSHGSTIAWTSSFTQFFEDCFLDDEAINMMLHWITLQVRRNHMLDKSVIIADLRFTQELLTKYEASSNRKSLMLERLEENIKSSSRNRLYFVVNPNKDHFAAVEVNFLLRTYSYGDSLARSRSPDTQALAALNRWLNSMFPSSTPFSAAPNLPCEQQQDSWSCGVAACTLISSTVGLEAPWSSVEALLHRYVWAERVMLIHQQSSTLGYRAESPLVIDTAMSAFPLSSGVQAEGHPMALGSILNGSDGSSALVSDVSLSDKSLAPLDSSLVLDVSSVTVGQLNENVDYVEKEGVLCFLDDDEAPALAPIIFEPKRKRSASNEGSPVRIQAKRPTVLKTPPKRSVSSATKALKNSALPRRSVSSNYPSERSSGPTGISRTAQHDREKLDAIANGTFGVDRTQIHRFLRHIRSRYDEHACLDERDPTCRTAIHSICGQPVSLDGPLRSSKFSRHMQTCGPNQGLRKNGKFIKAAKGCGKIDQMFGRIKAHVPTTPVKIESIEPPSRSVSLTPPPLTLVLCRGLRPEHDARILGVIERSKRGGTVSIHTVAKSEYGKDFKLLTEQEKTSVRNAVTATAKWVCHYEPIKHVRHAKCETSCDPDMSECVPSDVCNPCADLLHLRAFQTAMNRPTADEKNLKFVPKASRNRTEALLYARYVGLKDILEASDAQTTPLIQFVHRALQGNVKDAEVFIGLLQAMVTRDEKISRGKGMQGFRYAPAWLDFMHASFAYSPRAFELMRKSGFPVIGERELRKRRSRMPRFPIGITERTFQRAVDFLATIGFTGPVCISCDDTQLLSKLAPYYDAEQDKWFILGGVGEPVAVDGNEEDIESMLTGVIGTTEKATKLRLWCLQAAGPKIPVFILAAMAIGSTLKHQDLLGFHNRIINGLLDAGTCVSSYACDGSATERKVVHQFLESAVDRKTLLIPHARAESHFPPYPVHLYLYGPGKVPVVCLQDSKHALKTLRNVLYSGTRGIVIGNCTAHYLQLLMLSKDPRSPLFQRDVLKIDRQDDPAAARVFSSAVILLLTTIVEEQKKEPSCPILSKDLTGLMVYLFIFGELIDAFQNRFLRNIERVKMVLRTHYFLEIWRSSLAVLGYSESSHFITSQADQIVGHLIHGFLSLILLYRDCLDHENYPLCPWLHSTESCEHTFGEARKTKPDFTFADFLVLQPKLKVLFDSAVRNGEYEGGENARAAGYFHTQYSAKGIDIPALAVFPSDHEIFEAANLAFNEAEALFSLCGLPVTDSLYPSSTANVHLPPIGSWLPTEGQSEDGQDEDIACTLAEKPANVTAQLECLLRADAERPLAISEFDSLMDVYALSGVALEVEEQNAIDSLPDFDHRSEWKALRHAVDELRPTVFLPPLVLANEYRQRDWLEHCEIDATELGKIRDAHETHFAKSAIRTGSLKLEHSITTVSDENFPVSAHLARHKLVKRMHEALRSIQDKVGTGTGAIRRLHHEGKVSTAPAGNSANASAAAAQRGGSAMKSRAAVIAKAQLKCQDLIVNAGVSSLAPIQTGSYVIVLVDGQLWLAEVLTMYSKGAGKGGKYNWVPSASSISGVTNVLVQLWEHWTGREFRSIVKRTALYHAYRFAHVPWQHLLYVVLHSAGQQIEHQTPERMQIPTSLAKIWGTISVELPAIKKMMPDLMRRRQCGEGDEEEDT